MRLEDGSTRPSVSVVVPFYGSHREAAELLKSLRGLALAGGDEVLVVDNTAERAVAESPAGGRIRRVEARTEQSSYYARNVGAEAARNDWLLFVDADCRPVPDILDRYFASPIGENTGIVSGSVHAERGQDSLLTRYAESRRMLDSGFHSHRHDQPIGVTANLLVRREAWSGVGGFQEGIWSHGDSEFSFRVQDAQWRLIHRKEPAVAHAHRDTLGALFRQCARYGAGAAWLNRRRPRSCPRPRPVRELARCAAGVFVWMIAFQPERAAFKAVDVIAILGTSCGYLLSNTPPDEEGPTRAHRDPRQAAGHPPTAIMVDAFPALSETFVVEEVVAMERLEASVRVEAICRPERPNRGVTRGLEVDYLEDDGYLRRIGAAIWLLSRHSLRAVRDLATRRRWPPSEVVPLISLATVARRTARRGDRHLHAHFAGASAVSAARLSRLLGISHSVTAHAYEIFREPPELRSKLAGAAFVTTGCDYNVRYLRERVLTGDSPPVHEVIMGVDGERFRRRRSAPSNGVVVAVGRLVEKKGFHDLVTAASDEAVRGAASEIVIAGEGPQRAELEGMAERLGVSEQIEFVGWRDPAQVRDLLESASVLVMPSVVTSDGDRDSMPVVVKEALAMEVPVIASDEVGLPEVVREGWGRLVPPGDPEALAQALGDLLGRPPEERAAMGRAGREFVLRHCNVEEETKKLLTLIAAPVDD